MSEMGNVTIDDRSVGSYERASWTENVKSKPSNVKGILLFIICMLIPIGVGLCSAYLTKDNMMLFDEIKKPPLTPARMVFPIAWTILYLMMGLSSFLALRKCERISQGFGLIWPYVLQLILNFSWSLIFFNGRMFWVAFGCLMVMWVLIIISMTNFMKVSKLAGFMMLPYVLWSTFAAYLNLSIAIMN